MSWNGPLLLKRNSHEEGIHIPKKTIVPKGDLAHEGTLGLTPRPSRPEKGLSPQVVRTGLIVPTDISPATELKSRKGLSLRKVTALRKETSL